MMADEVDELFQPMANGGGANASAEQTAAAAMNGLVHPSIAPHTRLSVNPTSSAQQAHAMTAAGAGGTGGLTFGGGSGVVSGTHSPAAPPVTVAFTNRSPMPLTATTRPPTTITAPRSNPAATPAPNALSNSLAELLKNLVLQEFKKGEDAARSLGEFDKAQAYLEVQTELSRRSTSELKDIFTQMSPLISGPEKSSLLNRVMEEYKKREQVVRAQYQQAQTQVQAQVPAQPPPTKKQRVHEGDGPDNARATAQNQEEADELKTDVTDISGINLNEEQATMVPSLRAASHDAPATPSPIATFNRYLVEVKVREILKQNGLDAKEAGVTEYILHAAYERMVNLLNQAMDISSQRVSSMRLNENADLVSSSIRSYLQGVRDADERRHREAERKRQSALDSTDAANPAVKEAESMNETALRMLGAPHRRTRQGTMETPGAPKLASDPTPVVTAPSQQQMRRITRKDMILLMERDPLLRSSRNTHEIFLGIAPRKIFEEPINLGRAEIGDVPVLPSFPGSV